MDISVTLPLDADGFLRRQCPSCDGQFKWHDGPANEEAELEAPPISYYCPLCGLPASHDQWWTHEQAGYIQAAAMPAVMQTVQDELSEAFRGAKGIKFNPGNVRIDEEQRSALVEPDDMVIAISPCHSYEPVKVPEENASKPLHCLVCGARFTL